MKKVLTLILLACSISALAEYRVYQYIVKNKVESTDSPKSTLLTSSLDPVTYMAYNGGSNLISVDLLRTWICPGNTGQRKETCKSPYKKMAMEVIK